MIRLPPTGISLSENDIQFHMQQVEIYQGLLKQGFNKQEIKGYLQDYRKATLKTDESLIEIDAARAPRIVELACCRTQESLPPERTLIEDKVSKFSQSLDAPKASRSGEEHDEGQSEDDEDTETPESVSPVGAPASMHVNKHAPRQSSLLRHAEAASPDYPSDSSNEPEAVPLPVSPRAARYRIRSHTYPYVSSERERSSITNSDKLTDRFVQISLAERNPSDHSSSASSDGMPLPLPPPLSATPRRLPARAVMPTGADTSASALGYPGSSAVPGFSNSGLDPSQSSGLLGSFDSTSDIPSSPPFSRASSDDLARPLPDIVMPMHPPATPVPTGRAAVPQTDPRDQMPRSLDGSAFSVYNDSFPASSQPQTPADLSRGPYITQHEVAYTAPPGMGRFGSFSVTPREPLDLERNVGEQSPTIRAIGMRERRSREMWRSVRAEGARLRRIRQRDEALFMRRNEETGQPRLRRQQLEDPWRDDLDADRVGDENFETEFTNNQAVGMRVVSGNARFEVWEGENDR